MLGKLIKYEVPALGRKLLPLYAAWAVTACLLGITTGHVRSNSDFFVVISALMYSAVATAVFVMAVILIVQRFSRSLLGDEGYFAHALPVSAAEHISSKTISAMIWVFLSLVAMMLTGFLIALFIVGPGWFFSKEFTDMVREFFAGINANAVLVMLEMLIMILMSTAKSILAIYTALTIGHQAKRRTGLACIGAYIGVLVFESTVGRVGIALVPDMSELIDGPAGFHLFFLIVTLMTAAIGAVYFFICRYMLEKKLDLA